MAMGLVYFKLRWMGMVGEGLFDEVLVGDGGRVDREVRVC